MPRCKSRPTMRRRVPYTPALAFVRYTATGIESAHSVQQWPHSERRAGRSMSLALSHIWHSERFVHVIDFSHASNRDFLDLQITTLFLLDSEQRLLATNEPGTPHAPRFFLGRSADGHRWRVRYD